MVLILLHDRCERMEISYFCRLDLGPRLEIDDHFVSQALIIVFYILFDGLCPSYIFLITFLYELAQNFKDVFIMVYVIKMFMEYDGSIYAFFLQCIHMRWL